jgi:hypothetical protein
MRPYIIGLLLLTACASTPAKSPDSVDTEQKLNYDNMPTENVGIVFEDNRNSERRDRTPPPTSSYKISSKQASTK